MELICKREVIDVVRYSDTSAIIVEKLPHTTPNKYKAQYSVVDFENRSISLSTKSAYLLKKFGANFKRISQIIPNFIQCDAIVLPDRRVLAIFPNGEAGVFDRDGELEWSGSFEYHDKYVKCIAPEDKYFWSVCTDENCIVRYSGQNMKFDLRIGGADSQTFIKPCHICYDANQLYVCCDDNKVRRVDAENYTVSDFLSFTNRIEKYYKFGDYALAVMPDGTYVLKNNE